MSAVLSDDELSQALTAAAASYPVPDALELKGELGKQAVVAPWQRRRSVQLTGAAAAFVAFLLLTISIAGGGGPSIRQTDFASRNQLDRDGAAPAPSASGAPGASADSAAKDRALTGAGTGGAVAAPQAPPGSTSSNAPRDEARIVQTGTISLVVDDGKVSQAMGQLRAIATAARGYIAAEQSQGIGDDPTGTITMRVPVASFDAVVKQITGKGLGAKVLSSESSGKDVTAEYADTAAQIATLRAARNRYLTILNGARTIPEILSVQQRVDEVQGQIDRLEGSRRVLANQSDLATITVGVNEKRAEVLVTAERGGWSKAWHDAAHGFTSGVQSLIAHSGRTLLVLLVLAGGLLLGRSAWHLARRRLI